MNIAETIAELERVKGSTRFSRLIKICEEWFGAARVNGSHHIFRMPWPGDPRSNLQSDRRQSETVSGRTSDHRPKEIGRDIEVKFMANAKVKPRKNRAED